MTISTFSFCRTTIEEEITEAYIASPFLLASEDHENRKRKFMDRGAKSFG